MLIIDFDDPHETILQHTYPNFQHNYNNVDLLPCIAILTETIETIDIINQYISGLILDNNMFKILVYLHISICK